MCDRRVRSRSRGNINYLERSSLMNVQRHLAIFLGAIYICSGGAAYAATYYVATNGSDSRSCAQAQSASSPKQSLNNSIGCLQAGDTLYVRQGTYAEAIMNVRFAGTSWNSPIRIAAYPGETVWLTSAGAPYVVYLASGQQYIEFDGINLDGSSASTGVIQIASWSGGNAHHIRFKNAELVGNTNTNFNTAGSGPAMVLVTGQAAGIGGNEFISLTVHHAGNLIDTAPGFYIGSSDNLIDACDVYDTTGTGIEVFNGYGLTPNNNTIRNSRIHDITRGRPSNGGNTGWGLIVEAATSTKIYNNTIYRNTLNGAGHGLILSDAPNSQVFNNTVYANTGYGIEVVSYSPGTLVQNNISYSNYWNDYLDYGGGAYDSNNLVTDPHFVNAAGGDFRLRSDSPGIDAGTNVGVPYDQAGSSRPQGNGYDIGAFEYAGGGSTPPPSQPPSGGSGGTSPDGTRVPASSYIVDSSSATWTLGSNSQILRNGSQAGGGWGSQILWYQGTIYVLGDDNNWYRWNGSYWTIYSSSDPAGGSTGGGSQTPSPSGTRVPTASSIIDSSLNVWTIGSGQAILRNGTLAGYGYGTQILWYQGVIYVLGDDNNWWQWTGSTWSFYGSRAPA
jgi:hypothetical protein